MGAAQEVADAPEVVQFGYAKQVHIPTSSGIASTAPDPSWWVDGFGSLPALFSPRTVLDLAGSAMPLGAALTGGTEAHSCE